MSGPVYDPTEPFNAFTGEVAGWLGTLCGILLMAWLAWFCVTRLIRLVRWLGRRGIRPGQPAPPR